MSKGFPFTPFRRLFFKRKLNSYLNVFFLLLLLLLLLLLPPAFPVLHGLGESNSLLMNLKQSGDVSGRWKERTGDISG